MKKTFLTTIVILTACIMAATAHAQQNPPGKDWKYIDAGHYRIIFPSGLEEQAQRTANLMLYYEPYIYSGLSTTPRYIPIVIIDDFAEANGFVSAAPFFSHWFTTPASFDSIDWFTGLAIHEGRHMAQINRLREGSGKGAWNILFGDMGTAAFQVIFIPTWFMEGDAVVMETSLTKGGRGRLPYFPLWYRALEMSGERYSYYRAYLGTYDDMFPYANYYSLGYLICSYVNKNYGKEAWDRILENTGKYFIFHTFDRAVELETGKNVREIYSDAMDEYREYWAGLLAGTALTRADPLFPERKGKWESYLFPFRRGDFTYAIRFARDRKLSLVKSSDDTTEEIKAMPFDPVNDLYSNERGLTAGGGMVMWREIVPDPRWGYRTYSDLKIFSISSGKTFSLTHKRKFLSAALSPDGHKAAGIEYTATDGYSLSMFSTDSRELVSQSKMNGLGHIFDPAVSANGRYIALCSMNEKGNALLLYDTQSGKAVNITGYTPDERMKSPVFCDDLLFYVSDYTGTDNIYAVEIRSGKKFRVTSVMLGAYYPSVSDKGSTLIFNEYTVSGYKAVSMEIDRSSWVPFENLKKPEDPFVKAIIEQEPGPDTEVTGDVPDNTYEVSDYNMIKDGMSVPGWYVYFDSTGMDFSLNVMAQDVLQTTAVSASYIHNFNEDTDAGYGYLAYYGLYPVFTISGGYGTRAIRLDDNDVDPGEEKYITWKETVAEGDAKIPLDFSGGLHNISLILGISGGMIRVRDKNHEDWSIYEDINRDGYLEYSKYYLTFSHTVTGAPSSRIPRFGEILNVSYRDTLKDSDYRGSLFSTDATLFLPWFFDTHGIKLTGGYEFLDYENYAFRENFLFPRGYSSVRHRHMVKGGIDYMFPILDFSLPVWKLIYFKRLNGSLFYDYGAGITHGTRNSYPSAGIELTLVENLISNPYLLIEAGLRYSRCFETHEDVYEMVLTTPLY